MQTLIIATIMFFGLWSKPVLEAPAPNQTVYDFKVKTIDGVEQSLSAYKGKVLVFVNVASKCGYTSQYKDLEAFYQKYKDKNVVVLGFPANNFMGQEPGTDAEIKQFCTTKYNVTFPMFSKISVKGDNIHPLYKYLTGATQQSVKWNFNKFIVGKDGKVVKWVGSNTTPSEKSFQEDIEKLL